MEKMFTLLDFQQCLFHEKKTQKKAENGKTNQYLNTDTHLLRGVLKNQLFWKLIKIP